MVKAPNRPRPPRAHLYRYCLCGHNTLAHGDKGAGACEGISTVFDNGNGPDQCDCPTFRDADPVKVRP